MSLQIGILLLRLKCSPYNVCVAMSQCVYAYQCVVVYMCVYTHAQLLQSIQLFATLWTTLLSMGIKESVCDPRQLSTAHSRRIEAICLSKERKEKKKDMNWKLYKKVKLVPRVPLRASVVDSSEQSGIPWQASGWNSGSHCWGLGWIPGQGPKIPQAVRHSQKKKV